MQEVDYEDIGSFYVVYLKFAFYNNYNYKLLLICL